MSRDTMKKLIESVQRMNEAPFDSKLDHEEAAVWNNMTVRAPRPKDHPDWKLSVKDRLAKEEAAAAKQRQIDSANWKAEMAARQSAPKSDTKFAGDVHRQDTNEDEYEDDDGEDDLRNGDYVEDTQHNDGEVFQLSGYEPGARRCRISDANERGWYVHPSVLRKVTDRRRIEQYFGQDLDLGDEDCPACGGDGTMEYGETCDLCNGSGLAESVDTSANLAEEIQAQFEEYVKNKSDKDDEKFRIKITYNDGHTQTKMATKKEEDRYKTASNVSKVECVKDGATRVDDAVNEGEQLADLSKIKTEKLRELSAMHRHYGQTDPSSKATGARIAAELKKRTGQVVDEGRINYSGYEPKKSFKVTYYDPKYDENRTSIIRSYSESNALDYCDGKGYDVISIEAGGEQEATKSFKVTYYDPKYDEKVTSIVKSYSESEALDYCDGKGYDVISIEPKDELEEGRSENRKQWDRVNSKGTVPGIDRERYTDLSHEGLEGPFHLKNGKVVYYDPKQGQYYDRDTDMYIDQEDYQAMQEDTPAAPGAQQPVTPDAADQATSPPAVPGAPIKQPANANAAAAQVQAPSDQMKGFLQTLKAPGAIDQALRNLK